MKIKESTLIIAVVILLLVTACNGDSAVGDDSEGKSTPVGGVSGTGGSEYLSGQANVESVDVLIMESFPVQASVVVSGQHPDGCTQISNTEQEFLDEKTIGLTVYTITPANAECIEEVVPFEENFSLDVEGLPAGTYTVDVNGVTVTFELTVDNVAEKEPGTTCPEETADLSLFLNGKDGYCLLHPAWYRAGASQSNAAVISGPSLNAGGEQIEIYLSIDKLGSADGLLVEEIAEGQLSGIEDSGTDIEWGEIDLGGETAITADGVPGTFPVRQAFIVHEDTAYVLTVSPIDDALPAVSREAELLWEAVISSFTFVEESEQVTTVVEEDCTPDSEFVGDVTIPDGTEVVVGTSFVKTWRMRNNGTCSWNSAYLFVQIDTSGSSLVAYPHEIPLSNTKPGEEIDVSVTVELNVGAPPHTEQIAQFQMQAPNGDYFGDAPFVKVVVRPETAGDRFEDAGASFTGVVWNDVCAGSTTLPGGAGCIQGDDNVSSANGIIDQGETGIGGVIVSLTPGECASVEGTYTAVTSSDGSYGFYGLTAGPYCIFIDPLLETNFSILLPGGFTAPRMGMGGLIVYLNENENSVVNFGWDYSND
jgi:inhibitor of cysteine peptidase